MEFLGVVLLILGCIGFGIFTRHARERKQIKLSEMIHNERMKAMEKGLPEESEIYLKHQFSGQ